MRCTLGIVLVAILLLVNVGGEAWSQARLRRERPEGSSVATPQVQVDFRSEAVATANRFASDAAYRMLKAGGSAIDAAIAAQLVLNLVEPQSSGIGGGAFLIYTDGKKVRVYDGRETAPMAATGELFIKDGKPMSFTEAVVGGRSVGVPGVLRMLELAHRQHGRLPWSRLFVPAIALATVGFPVSPRLHQLLLEDNVLKQDARARAYFYDVDGAPWPVGHVLKNPELARVLRLIARGGAARFYRGPLARAMVAAVRNHATNPGLLSPDDLAHYRARERQPLCFDHEVAGAMPRHYSICGVPPPASGAIAMAQMLGMLNNIPERSGERLTPLWLHGYIEAARLAFADRALYVADPDFVAAPAGDWTSLFGTSYLRQRAQLIGQMRMREAPAGQPMAQARVAAPMPLQIEHGTSHISIVDRHGNALAMTTSIENAFGARVMVSSGLPGGFLLNNQLTDFSFTPADAQGRLVANRVEPGKRPRSSMSPTLIFERKSDGSRGALVASLGSPGGPAIIHYTAKVIYALLHWDMQAQAAIDLPNFVIFSPEGAVQIEAGLLNTSFAETFARYGHTLRRVDIPSGLQVLERISGTWHGGTDPRREGSVLGD